MIEETGKSGLLMYPWNLEKKKMIPALIGAGICLLLLQGGLFAFFFLVPLGFLSFRFDYRTAWAALLFAAAANLLLILISQSVLNIPARIAIWDFLFFTAMALVFTWIAAPPPSLSFKMPGSFRFVIGSCIGSLLFTGLFFRAAASEGFLEEINAVLNLLISFNRSAGSDAASNAAQNALPDGLNAEAVLEMMKAIILRGGSLISCVFLFFFSRQFSLALVRLLRREKGISVKERSVKERSVEGRSVFMAFHVYPPMIWVLSASLFLLVLFRVTRLEIPEIILWNVLILCVILYFAQGLGIIRFFLSKTKIPPVPRVLLSGLFVMALFGSLGAFILAGLVILGIAETWAPFRAPKKNGPPSTPEAGDSD